MNITLSLHVDEVAAVLNTLGQLPTSSNAWPLAVKITRQRDAAIAASSQAAAPADPAQPEPVAVNRAARRAAAKGAKK